LETAGLHIKLLRIPGAKDPDEYIKTYGAAAFSKLLDQSEEHMEYTLRQLQEKYVLTDDRQRVEFAKEAAEQIASLPSPVEREVYAARAGEAAGIEKDAILLEVNRAFKRRVSKQKKKQERQDLLPAVQVQPRARELRYTNLRSARAEEGVLRLLLLDESLFPAVEDLTEEQFSSPFLGKLFAILCRRKQEGASLAPAAFAEELSAEELSHLAEMLEKPESLSAGAAALGDYRAVITKEQMTKAGESDEAFLLAARGAYQKKKSMGDVYYERG
jgi:DNA primase